MAQCEQCQQELAQLQELRDRLKSTNAKAGVEGVAVKEDTK